MKKIRLNPEALEVCSFATVPAPAVRAGTIQGHQEPLQTEAYTCFCGGPQTDPMTIVTFCTNGGSCVDGPCKADSRMSQCVC
jgi:hypothetical protein